jgi:outer membrane lipoprotein-sorting protein
MKRSICLLALFALAAAPSSYAEQGNMQAALASLKDAQASLLKVSNDKGGHTQNALQLVQQAIAEVKAGMQYQKQNPKKD